MLIEERFDAVENIRHTVVFRVVWVDMAVDTAKSYIREKENLRFFLLLLGSHTDK